MTRICVLLIMLGLCAACVDNPYINPVKTDKGTTIAATFSYGKFCGANTPILQRRDPETGKSIFTELRTLWPPADDLDAACYAHDYCELQAYQESFGRQVFASMRTLCDQALVRTLADVNQDFADPSCFNLAHDMTAGMYLRVCPGFSAKRAQRRTITPKKGTATSSPAAIPSWCSICTSITSTRCGPATATTTSRYRGCRILNA